MNDSPVKIRDLILFSIFSFIIVFCIFLSSYFNQRTIIVFCDVGQGDGAYIRIKNSIDLVIDAGPDSKILNCLGKHMPFYDKTIEYAVLTHLQKDHYGGFIPLLDRYRIKNFIAPQASNISTLGKTFLTKLQKKNIRITQPSPSDVIKIYEGDSLLFYWPPKNLPVQNNDNNSTLVFTFQEKNMRILFTGDAPKQLLDRLSKTYNLQSYILKVPHHGSKNGLSQQFLKLANPTLSVISVGKNNSYGHPAKEVLEIFQALKKKYLRTDEMGEIVIKITADEKADFH